MKAMGNTPGQYEFVGLRDPMISTKLGGGATGVLLSYREVKGELCE
jgi:hypothetical protein